ISAPQRRCVNGRVQRMGGQHGWLRHAIRSLVTARHAVLPIGAVLVLALGVYLYVEVRAQPAPPNITRKSQPSHLADNEAVATPPPPAPTPPATPPAAGARHVFRDPSMTAIAVAPSPSATREVATGSAASDTNAAALVGPKLD